MKLLITISAILCISISFPIICMAENNECVILLHGLARTNNSMNKLKTSLELDNYFVVNKGYASTKHKIEELSNNAIPNAINECRKNNVSKINFVTHSMGGILARYYLSNNDIAELGRVVMLSPPNKGSEIVDKLGNTKVFEFINGPAGKQLGTDDKSLPNSLPSPNYELGIITGDRSINWINSSIIPGQDDGKVSVKNAQIDGAKDFIVIHATHTFIMNNETAIRQIKHFLKNGEFAK